jgi:hypothetical protein
VKVFLEASISLGVDGLAEQLPSIDETTKSEKDRQTDIDRIRAEHPTACLYWHYCRHDEGGACTIEAIL